MEGLGGLFSPKVPMGFWGGLETFGDMFFYAIII